LAKVTGVAYVIQQQFFLLFKGLVKLF